MKNGVYSLLKARFLIDDDAVKNWRFIVFVIALAIIMIANTQRFEQKVFKIAELTNRVKELRSEFVDRRSELMKLKMESTVANKMVEKQIFPSTVPPIKIKVKKEEEKSFFKKIQSTQTSPRTRLSVFFQSSTVELRTRFCRSFSYRRTFATLCNWCSR